MIVICENDESFLNVQGLLFGTKNGVCMLCSLVLKIWTACYPKPITHSCLILKFQWIFPKQMYEVCGF